MTLFIVPVPIGNLGDITLRAIEVLKTVDFIIAEDTRYSLKLLNHLQIKKSLYSYYKPKEQEKSEKILGMLKNQNAAIITDSGTPLVSDPGFVLVKKAIAAGVEIISLPGPTAFVPALVGSGIDPARFLFLGFPPRKKSELVKFLKESAPLPYTLVFYESPRRLEDFLRAASDVLGHREFAIAKELSKKHETFIRGNLGDLEETLAGEIILGEVVAVIAGNSGEEEGERELRLESREDIFDYFKEKHNISRNHIKGILMKK
jgi:16S rRNA (cytidine1402-2'-O)-methyltransferase